MPPDAADPGPPHARRLRLAWLVWLGIIGLVLGRGLVWPHKNNCFLEHYRPGGLNWFNGDELYGVAADTCRYSPLVHAALVPFSLPAPRWGALLWRLAEGAAFLAALGWWLRAVCPRALSGTQRGWLLLAVAPLAIGSINNGQSNVFMVAAILAGTAALAQSRWNAAALFLALACFIKVYPVALALLFVVLYPRQLGGRLALAALLGLALPFAFQDPGYVWRQYGRWFGNMRGDDRSDWQLVEAYRDAWLLVRITGLPLGVEAYRVIQAGAGALLALICIGMRRRGDGGRDLLNRALGLGCCWMTAFGPATESPTYILLGPTLAWLLAESWRGALPGWTRVPLTAAAGLFAFTAVAVTTPHGRAVLALGPQPAAALLILGTLLAVVAVRPVQAVRPAESKESAEVPETRGLAA
jgi:hypothetical protein